MPNPNASLSCAQEVSNTKWIDKLKFRYFTPCTWRHS